ncbi:hypothetical protein D3C71_449040 [compost metagenome]
MKPGAYKDQVAQDAAEITMLCVMITQNTQYRAFCEWLGHVNGVAARIEYEGTVIADAAIYSLSVGDPERSLEQLGALRNVVQNLQAIEAGRLNPEKLPKQMFLSTWNGPCLASPPKEVIRDE